MNVVASYDPFCSLPASNAKTAGEGASKPRKDPKMKSHHAFPRAISWLMTLCVVAAFHPVANACTGITLRAQDGAVVYGRTLEWGTFDLRSRIVIFPRGHQFVGETPDGTPGRKWTGQYGIVGIDMLEKAILGDGMNEQGLVAGLFYHPGFATYEDYDPANADRSIAPTDVMQYILSNFATVEEARQGLTEVSVVNVVEPALGFPAPVHLMITDPTGEQIVVEWKDGAMQIFEAPLGVITNAPTYDWHMTNIRNYINLSPVAVPSRSIDELDFSPLGGGSGMIGLPGDFTPPSRFVRAVAFAKTARPTADGPETIYEIFRILDNFNVPLGASEGDGDDNLSGMRSSTIWTCAHDLRNQVLYYHTQHNRQVRKIDVASVDFSSLEEMQVLPLDERKEQAIKDRTPR